MHNRFCGRVKTERQTGSRKLRIALLVSFLICGLITLCAPLVILAMSNEDCAPHQPPQTNFSFEKIEWRLDYRNYRDTVTQTTGGGYLGVYLGDVNEERAKQLRLSEVRGAIVGKVEENSPAAVAGLKENDVILTFNDQKVQNRTQFYRLLVESSPGTKVTLGITREGVTRDIAVELGQRRSGYINERKRLFSEADAMLVAAKERHKEAEELLKKGDEKGAQNLFEEEKAFLKQAEESRAYTETQIREGKISQQSESWFVNYNINANRYYLGLIAAPLSDQLAKFFNVAGGVLVSEVRAGGAAESAGIKAGDCITAVNNDLVTSTFDFNRLVDGLGKNGKMEESPSLEFVLTIVRDRSEQKIKIKIDSR